MELVTVAEAAKRLNRNPESVRKVIDARRVEKHYASGKQRFWILWADIAAVSPRVPPRESRAEPRRVPPGGLQRVPPRQAKG